ncbi:MAG: hypothetical protein Q8O10_00530 [candidate division Zixibacteria bacterium]|nr:hypothetical protein [candidate division Zixibacteria bacterium]
MRIISKDTITAVSTTLIGVVVGYLISMHFYQVTKKEVKEQLINSALVEVSHNTFKGNYPQLFDSIQYAGSGSPWRKLVTTGIDRLYFDAMVFIDYDKFVEFVNIVNEAKLTTDDFNDRITLRNLSILLDPKAPTFHNPKAYHYYQAVVRPAILKLHNYLTSNYKELIK